MKPDAKLVAPKNSLLLTSKYIDLCKHINAMQHLLMVSGCELGKSIDTGQETPKKSKAKNTFESCSGKSEIEDTWCLISICTLQKQKLKIEHDENSKLYVFASAFDFLFSNKKIFHLVPTF